MMKQTLTAAALSACGMLAAWEPVTLKTVEGAPWSVTVLSAAGAEQRLECSPPEIRAVERERYAKFPLYNPKAWGGWQKGVCLNALRTQECSAQGALDPASLRIESEDGRVFEAKKDYDGDFAWGSFGRLPDGAIAEGSDVLISFAYSPSRIDSVMRRADGTYRIVKGAPDMATPRPPLPENGEACVANIYFCGRPEKLSEGMFFSVLETAYPATDLTGVAASLLPETLQKLRNGEPLKILAFGDSVTVGSFLGDNNLRWQDQFVAELKRRFPQSKIELITVAWGGRSTRDFLAEPAGSVYNYEEKVLAAKPDLVISEFVNDAGLQPEQWKANYSRFLNDFRKQGIEWLILTPHYIRPDWMGLDRQRDIDNDPRAYVKFLREFTAENKIALADASLRFGRLWRQGIPYNSLMLNCINHPDERGMAIFLQALTALFPEK